jgi:hypothetical protein
MENIDGGLPSLFSIDLRAFIKLCHVVDQLKYGEILE